MLFPLLVSSRMGEVFRCAPVAPYPYFILLSLNSQSSCPCFFSWASLYLNVSILDPSLPILGKFDLPIFEKSKIDPLLDVGNNDSFNMLPSFSEHFISAEFIE
jgi:hypothetical protein